MFENAVAAAEAANQNQASTEEAPKSDSGVEIGNAQAASDFLDLGKYEKFKFEGKDWTQKEFKESLLRNEDYTRKTQEISQDRRFVDNLRFDLDAVRKNPALQARFREIYPEKYHPWLDWVRTGAQVPGAGQMPASSQGVESQKPSLDPAIRAELDELKQSLLEDKVQAHMKQLEAWDQKFQSKYPYVSPDLQELIYERAKKVDGSLDEGTYEKVWKTLNDAVEKVSVAQQKKLVDQQKGAFKASRDAAPGGGIPGGAPKKVPLKDVGDYIISQMKHS